MRLGCPACLLGGNKSSLSCEGLLKSADAADDSTPSNFMALHRPLVAPRGSIIKVLHPQHPDQPPQHPWVSESSSPALRISTCGSAEVRILLTHSAIKMHHQSCPNYLSPNAISPSRCNNDVVLLSPVCQGFVVPAGLSHIVRGGGEGGGEWDSATIADGTHSGYPSSLQICARSTVLVQLVATQHSPTIK